MAAKKYVVVAPFVGNLNRGDIVEADALPSDAKAHVADGSVREATADEVKAGWLEYTDKKGNPVLPPKDAPVPAATEAPALESAGPKAESGGGKK